MPQYKLTYFNFRARGEVSRYLFALADVDYEDFRVDRSTWDDSELKRGSIFGQLPMLEVDGKRICQSHAIERYLARKFGFVGKTEWDEAKIDMVVECMEDFVRPGVAVFRENDENKKKELIKKYTEEQAPQFLDCLEKILKENDKGYFVGDGITLADLAFYEMINLAPAVMGGPVPASWERWPKLKVLYDRVGGHPKIKAWIEKRPVTPI